MVWGGHGTPGSVLCRISVAEDERLHRARRQLLGTMVYENCDQGGFYSDIETFQYYLCSEGTAGFCSLV